MKNNKYRVGSSSMQGWRLAMNDVYYSTISMPLDPGTAFFGLYDGYGGRVFAKHVSCNLHKYIFKRPEYFVKPEQALIQGFLDIDFGMMYDPIMSRQLGGTTALVVMIQKNKLFCANAGHSRAIACVNGEILILSKDHKTCDGTEAMRIVEAGGWIENERVNGLLTASRAMGNFRYKNDENKLPDEQIVTAYPEVVNHKIDDNWEFIVLASDGVWSVMSNEEVTKFCRKRIARGMNPEEICEDLLDYCLAPCGHWHHPGTDNMTITLVCFMHNKGYYDLMKRCATSSDTLWNDGL